jgi:hypothetical protein
LSHAKLVSTDLSHARCEGAKFDGAVGMGSRFREKWGLPPEEGEVVKSPQATRKKDSKKSSKKDKDNDDSNSEKNWGYFAAFLFYIGILH